MPGKLYFAPALTTVEVNPTDDTNALSGTDNVGPADMFGAPETKTHAIPRTACEHSVGPGCQDEQDSRRDGHLFSPSTRDG